MIKVPFPHMVLNSHDLPFDDAKFRMWNTYDVPADHNVDHILGWTAIVAKAAPGGKLATLVISCHGYESESGRGGYGLAVGTGIYRAHTPQFSKLKGLVGQIWIFACKTADIAVPGEANSLVDGDGNWFCSEIATASGASVVASQATQRGKSLSFGISGGLPAGYIPDWEGMVLTYGPAGNVVATKKYW